MNEGLVVAIRGAISFFSLLIFARILGKQQISQLNFFDYIIGITLGSIAASLTTDLTSRAWPHWIGLITWVILGICLEKIAMANRSMGNLIDGEPVIVIAKGKILEKALKRVNYRISDLNAILRNKDIFNIEEVEFAVIEPNGQLSVLKKAEEKPVTRKDMKIQVKSDGLRSTLIYDGMVMEVGLRELNMTIESLYKELNKHGINDVKEVFYAAKAPEGKIYIDKYEDYISRITKI